MILDNIYESLAILYISLPNSVTTYNYKLILITLPLKWLNVRLASNHLLMVTQILVFLVLEITKRTSKIQSTIYPTHVNHSSSVLNTLLLFLTLRFMVKRKIDSFALPAEDAPWVSSISHIEMGGCDKNYISRATSVFWNRIRDMDIPNAVELNAGLLTFNLFIHFFERLVQSLGINLVFVCRSFFENADKFPLNIFAHFVTFITEAIPPCPSKTAKRELPSPKSASWMSASSIDFLHPE